MIAENVLKLEQNYIRIQEENTRLQRALGEDQWTVSIAVITYSIIYEAARCM